MPRPNKPGSQGARPPSVYLSVRQDPVATKMTLGMVASADASENALEPCSSCSTS